MIKQRKKSIRCLDCKAAGFTRYMLWQPGNYYEHAGWECQDCRAFVADSDEYDLLTVGGEDYHSDADPGL